MKKLNVFLISVLLFFSIILITINPLAKSSAYEGIMLCQNAIIPALLPILIITNIIISTKSCEILNNSFGFITVKMLRLPKCTTATIILSLIGGYPTGAILVNHLVETNQIDTKVAQRLMNFCFCGGMGFIITSVGTITLNSVKLGLIFYLINITVSIIIAFISSFFYPKIKYKNTYTTNYIRYSEAIVKAVETSIKSILNMCAYIILFSCILGIINIPNKLIPIFEITNGICNNTLPITIICPLLYFGGLCVHFQIIPLLKNCSVKYSSFLIWRIIGCMLSFILIHIYLSFFPQSAQVFSNISNSVPKFCQVNNTLSILMILSSYALIIDLDSKKHHLPN